MRKSEFAPFGGMGEGRGDKLGHFGRVREQIYRARINKTNN